MAMDREALRDEVRANIKRTTSGVANTRINQWLDWGQTYVADLHTYEEMRKKYTASTADGTKLYTFPSEMKDIYTLTVQDGASSQALIYVPARHFDNIVPRSEQTSENRPRWYVDYGASFECYPIPDAVYTLNMRCSIYPSDFSADTSESTLLRKDALIAALATTFGFWSLREIEDATYWGSQIVPFLYKASLSSDHSGEDWKPVARGFDSRSGGTGLVGEYWTSPFVGRRL